ncbi:MAG: hypothetical protein ACP5I2_07480 [Fervidicoccaceae archaeon]|nr:MAG: hypothetical protein C0179_04165 [Fervidicoccus sp.]
MKLIIPYSPSRQVLLGTLGYEIATGEKFEEIILTSEQEPEEMLEIIEKISRALGAKLSLRVLGRDPRSWARLEIPEDTILDITPGRKIYASILLQKCLVSRSCRARYLYIEEEKKYGYKFFGYMPKWSFKFFELHPELNLLKLDASKLKEVHISDSQEHSQKVAPETIQAIVNLYSQSGANEFSIEACGGRAEFEFTEESLILKSYSSFGSGDLEAFEEVLSSSLELENKEEVYSKLSKCVSEGGIIVPDTNVFIHGRIFDYLKSQYKYVEIMKPVWAELLPQALEEKETSLGRKKLLGVIRATALNKTIPTMDRMLKGDVEIINSLKKLLDERKKVCFLTSDARLSLAVSNVLRGDEVLMRAPSLEEGRKFCAEELYSFFLNLAFQCKGFKLSMAERTFSFELGRIGELGTGIPNLKLKGPERADDLAFLDMIVRETL